jgi:D-3-phosphoglycerate dehydrogenase / 2-oxoglutarate reductase
MSRAQPPQHRKTPIRRPRTPRGGAAGSAAGGAAREAADGTTRGAARPQNLRVLLLEGIHPAAREILAAEGFRVEEETGALNERALSRAIVDFDAVGIRSKTRVTQAVLNGAERLWALGCFCIGTNQVDLEAARNRGVPVFNAPFSNTRSVAELILCEMIALARQMGERSREVHAGVWRKVARGCHEVRGRTVGIIGYGHIGSQVGVLAEAVGMRVIYYDIARKLPMGNNRSVAGLSELLSHAEFVTLHVPATARTRGLIGAAEIARMRPGSYLLNASRGDVVQIAALADAIRSGHLAGAAVDVFPEEPESNSEGFESELRGLPNVILTPHVGGATEEAQEAIGREVATSLVQFLRGGATTGAVNFPPVELPVVPGSHRILNVHHNVPGVLGNINRIASEHRANIERQILSTDAAIGYLIMDVAGAIKSGLVKEIAALDTSIRTRALR